MHIYYFHGFKGKHNFGDELNSWLWNKLVPKIKTKGNSSSIVAIGTLLNKQRMSSLKSSKKIAIFGSGTGYGIYPQKQNNWKIYFVRGPKTANALGISNKFALTDAAVLVRKIIKPADVEKSKRYHISYMPHWNSSIPEWQSLCQKLDIHFIDPTDDSKKIIKQISKSEMLVAEAMHGAIVADALRVPWRPVISQGNPDVIHFKWQDWCSSLQLEYKPYRISTHGKLIKGRNIFKWRYKYYLARKELKKIIKTYNPILSKDEIFFEKYNQVLDKLESFKSDLESGYFD